MLGIFQEYRRRSVAPVSDDEFDFALLLSKDEVIRVSSPFTNASFARETGNKSFYTAWDSHKTLVAHGLLKATPRPIRYALTTVGYSLAKRLYEVERPNDSFEKDSSPSNDVDAVPAPADRPAPRATIQQTDIQLLDTDSAIASVALERVQTASSFTVDAVAVDPRLDSFRFCASTTMTRISPAKRFAVPEPRPADMPNQTQSASRPRISVKQFTRHKISEVLLVIDNREKSKKRNNSEDATTVQQILQKCGVNNSVVRQLILGDFLWIGKTATGEEIVLDSIVERKKLPDLISSIVDKRYKEQKFRLKKSGLDNIIYLVEGEISDGLFLRTKTLKADGVESVLASTQIDDEFIVTRTNSARETWDFIKSMTNEMSRWVGREVITLDDDDLAQFIGSKVENKSNSSYLAPSLAVSCQGGRLEASEICPTLTQFNELSSKSNFTIGEMFAQQLMSVRRNRATIDTWQGAILTSICNRSSAAVHPKQHWRLQNSIRLHGIFMMRSTEEED